MERGHSWVFTIVSEHSDAGVMLEILLLEVGYMYGESFGIGYGQHGFYDSFIKMYSVNNYVHVHTGRERL